MNDPLEQRIVENILGAIRTTQTKGVDEGQPPVDPRSKPLPWSWVMVEETAREHHGTVHTQIELGVSVLTIFEAKTDADAFRMARRIRAEHEAALLADEKRGLTNPRTDLQPHIFGASGDGLWGVEIPLTVTFQHVRGNPWEEGA
jgi:hypothetical protein